MQSGQLTEYYSHKNKKMIGGMINMSKIEVSGMTGKLMERYGYWSDAEYWDFFNRIGFKHYTVGLDECKKWCDYCIENEIECLDFNDDYVVNFRFDLWFQPSKAYKRFHELINPCSFGFGHRFIMRFNGFNNISDTYFVVASSYRSTEDWFREYEYNVVLFNPLLIDYIGFVEFERHFTLPDNSNTSRTYGLTMLSKGALEYMMGFMMADNVFFPSIDFKPFEIVKDDYY